jgi:hypothetical protein
MFMAWTSPTRWSHDRDELALRHIEIDAAEGVDRSLTGPVDLRDPLEGDHRRRLGRWRM